MNKNKDVLKFDSGADGFKFMIYVLAISALVTLLLGGYFLYTNFYRP